MTGASHHKQTEASDGKDNHVLSARGFRSIPTTGRSANCLTDYSAKRVTAICAHYLLACIARSRRLLSVSAMPPAAASTTTAPATAEIAAPV